MTQAEAMASRVGSAAATDAADAALLRAIETEASAVDDARAFPRRSIAVLRDAGWLGPEVAAGAGRRTVLDRLRRLGGASLPVARLYEGHVNALLLVETYADAALAARVRADARAGRLFAVWNTEGGSPVTLEGAPTRAVLRGTKTFASAAGHAARAIVTAVDDARRRWMLLVDLERAGASVDTSGWRPLGMRPTASGAVSFDGVRVGADDGVACAFGDADDYFREPVFTGGATRFGAAQIGAAEALLERVRVLLASTGRGADAHQRARAGRMAAACAGARLWLDEAARRGAGCPWNGAALTSAEVQVAFAATLRVAVETACVEVLELGARAVGARGMLSPEPFERIYRDLTHYLRQAVPDQVLEHAGGFALGGGSLWPPPPAGAA